VDLPVFAPWRFPSLAGSLLDQPMRQVIARAQKGAGVALYPPPDAFVQSKVKILLQLTIEPTALP